MYAYVAENIPGENIMKIRDGIILSLLLLSCESREDRTSKNEDKILKNLITAGTLSSVLRDAAKVPCSATVSEANTDTVVSIPAEGKYKICGQEKLSGASVKFQRAGKYRITAAEGTQVLESSRCNSMTFSIDVTFSSSYGTKIAASVDASSSADHTSDSGIIYNITSNGPKDPQKYSCINIAPTSRIAEAYSIYFDPL